MTNQSEGSANEISCRVDDVISLFRTQMDELRKEINNSDVSDYVDAIQISKYLLKLEAFGYQMAVAPETNKPVIQSATFFQAHGFRIGMQSPNFLYRAIFLDGANEYRMFGQRGSTLFHQCIVMSGGYSDGKAAEIGNYELDDFTDQNGQFDIILSADKTKENAIYLDPESKNNWVFMRECCQDWAVCFSTDTVDIEPIAHPVSPVKKLTIDEYEYKILGIARLVKALHYTASWPVGGEINLPKTGPNQFSALGHVKDAAYNPVTEYLWCLYDLAEDEALIVECTLPDKYRYWDICAGDTLAQNSDYTYSQCSLSNFQTDIDSDNTVRLVISAEDPGVKNWIDVSEHDRGFIIWRWYWVSNHLNPKTKVIKLDSIKEYLPATTGFISAQERVEALKERRRAVLARYNFLS